jgi:hypothetical protein
VEIMYERVAAIDVGKKIIAVAVRTPGERAGKRRQQVRKYNTFHQTLAKMVAWLTSEGVTHVSMEATGIYWKPIFHALCEAERPVEVLLVNARHVKNVPGRKSDALDAVWLAELTECGLLRGSFIPPAQIAAIRELTRYRKKLIEQRTSELQRLAKALEDSGIKIDSVASKLTTLSARDMIEALIAGERDPAVLADLARGVMRKKIPELTMACAGRFSAQHALMCTLHLEHIDHLADMITRLDTRIDEATLPFARQTELLATIPGIGERAAQVIHLRDRRRHDPVPHRRAPGVMGRLMPGQQRIRRTAPIRQDPQGQPGTLRDPHRVRLVRRAHQHLCRCPVPPLPPPVRQKGWPEGRYRHRPHPDRDHLACAHRDHRLPRPRPGLLHPPHRQSRRSQTPAHSRTRSPRTQGHHRTQRRVTGHQHQSPTNPAPSRVTNPCVRNVPSHRSFVSDTSIG